MKICLFDTGIANNEGALSSNLGDVFIQEAVEREIQNIFKNYEFLRISTHDFPTEELIKKSKECSFIFVGGTNLLSSNLDKYRQWRISTRQMLRLPRVILLGVGWHSYQGHPNIFSRFFLNFLLSKKIYHSVRDSYAKNKLNSAGISNVINTGCPTMWPLKDYTANCFPKEKAQNVLVMLTDYAKDPEMDKNLLKIVRENYDKVFFWPQGSDDITYLSGLIEDKSKISILKNTTKDLNDFIDSGIDFDYIGTRLHGGIKCLLSKKRSIIIEVDNRAAEIFLDTNLPTIKRNDFPGLIKWINNSPPIKIKLDTNAINLWRTQFNPFRNENTTNKLFG